MSNFDDDKTVWGFDVTPPGYQMQLPSREPPTVPDEPPPQATRYAAWVAYCRAMGLRTTAPVPVFDGPPLTAESVPPMPPDWEPDA